MTERAASIRRHALLVAALAAFAGGCSVLESSPTDFVENAGTTAPVCSTTAGAYYLPKALIEFRIKKTVDATTKKVRGYSLDFTPSDKRYVADANLTLCLDYLASATAKDTVLIDRTPDGLLKTIDANVEDRSAQIVSSIIDIARATALANRNTRFRSTVFAGTVEYEGIYEFDPFDRAEVAAINAAMRRYGYCFYVKRHTFRQPFTPDTFCQTLPFDPNDAPAITVAERAAILAEAQRAILYRPNEVHEIVIMFKRNPDGPGLWRAVASHAIESPNVAPVFSIGVSRAFLATRKTLLKFEYGVLRDVEIDKNSELQAISEIPLKIAQAAVALPAQIVTLRINQVNNEQALIAAQAQLIETFRDYQAARGVIVVSNSPNSPPGRSAEQLRRDFCAEEHGDQGAEFAKCLTAN